MKETSDFGILPKVLNEDDDVIEAIDQGDFEKLLKLSSFSYSRPLNQARMLQELIINNPSFLESDIKKEVDDILDSMQNKGLEQIHRLNKLISEVKNTIDIKKKYMKELQIQRDTRTDSMFNMALLTYLESHPNSHLPTAWDIVEKESAKKNRVRPRQNPFRKK